MDPDLPTPHQIARAQAMSLLHEAEAALTAAVAAFRARYPEVTLDDLAAVTEAATRAGMVLAVVAETARSTDTDPPSF